MGFLGIISIYLISAIFMFFLYKFLGNSGLMCFGIFGIIEANALSTGVTEMFGFKLANGSPLFILVAFAFILFLSFGEKLYAKKLIFLLPIVAFFAEIINLLGAVAWGKSASFSIVPIADICSIIISFSATYFIFNRLNKNRFNSIINALISLIALAIIDSIIFNFIISWNYSANEVLASMISGGIFKIISALISVILFIPLLIHKKTLNK